MTTDFSILGNIDVEEFLSDYWQKKPALIRNAIANFQPPIEADELAGLSLESEVESRLVIGSDCQLEQGPFKVERLQNLPAKHWTLLIQAVDLWVPEVAELLHYFSFLPPWRLDDIMVSCAADGGSVGPHFDSYDVFLLQGAGQRRWRIGGYCDHHSALTDHQNVKILADFNFTDEWILQTGDMLYLPPRIAHHGIAIGDCTTFSVGFRTPSVVEMLGDLATELLVRDTDQRYLVDPPLTAAMANTPIATAYIDQVKALLLDTLNDDQMIGEWFAQFVTEPKYPQLIEQTGECRSAVFNSASKNGRLKPVRYKNGMPDPA